jgi:HEPN domain-containing protein
LVAPGRISCEKGDFFDNGFTLSLLSLLELEQQAAEKTVKAAFQAKGGSAIGHGIGALLHGLKNEEVSIPEEVRKAAKVMDVYYIMSRHPDGMVEGIPADDFDQEDADGAIRSAGEILRFYGGLLA